VARGGNLTAVRAAAEHYTTGAGTRVRSEAGEDAVQVYLFHNGRDGRRPPAIGVDG
jgi:hypothetical protein